MQIDSLFYSPLLFLLQIPPVPVRLGILLPSKKSGLSGVSVYDRKPIVVALTAVLYANASGANSSSHSLRCSSMKNLIMPSQVRLNFSVLPSQ